jgi:hypothetical protein
MIKGLLLRYLRHHWRLLLSIAAGVAGMEWMIVWTLAEMNFGPDLLPLLQALIPPRFHDMFFSQNPILSFPGFVTLGFSHPMVLVAVTAFQIVVGSLVAAERESGFLDLILARAVFRSSYFVTMLLLIVIGAITLPLSVVGGTAVGLALVEHPDEVPWYHYIPAAVTMSALLLAIGGIALLLAAGARRRGPAAAWAAGLMLALFVLESLADQSDIVARFRWISLFHYYKPAIAAVGSGLRMDHLLLFLGVFVLSTFLAHRVFRRQDL